MYKETALRSIVKTVSYRLTGSVATAFLVLLFVGDLTTAVSVGGIDALLKIVVYFLHERVWDRVKFGKHEIKPFVIWITGLSGSGKTSVAAEVARQLQAAKLKVEHLDGETVRHIFPHTGFTREAVNDHIERVGHLASRLEQNGVFVVASFISPYRESREFVRKMCRNFILVHLSTPVEECEKRDPSGIYGRARAGEVRMVVGVDLPYEQPVNAQITMDTSRHSTKDVADEIMRVLKPHL